MLLSRGAAPRVFAVLAGLLSAGPLFAEAPLHERIDQAIGAAKGYDRLAAPPAGDAEFLRRVCLDLTGAIPSADDVRAFLAERPADKRRRLVDRLLAGDGYARHMQHVFDALLMDRRPNKHVKQADWQEFL